MPLRDAITVTTELFEHRAPQPHFINPCCFGEDFAAWLRAELAPLAGAGFALSEPIQEDYGWGLWARHGADTFWIALSCCQDEPGAGPAEWVISVDYDAGLNIIKRLFHRADAQAFDQVRDRIRQSLAANPAIAIVP
jgi:hypothetical protein